jgi:hypothetical protein
MEKKPTQLYRHFDVSGILLYVGISLSTAQRLSQHMSGSKWAAEITAVKIEHFPSREEAEEAERLAIVKEKPVWNVVHNRPEKPKKEAAHRIPRVSKQNIDAALTAIDFMAGLMDRLRELSVMADIKDGEYGGNQGFVFTTEAPMTSEDLGLDSVMQNTGFSTGRGGANLCSYRTVTTPEITAHAIWVMPPERLISFCSNALFGHLEDLVSVLEKYQMAYDQFEAKCRVERNFLSFKTKKPAFAGFLPLQPDS